MSALTQGKTPKITTISTWAYPLAANTKVYAGGVACIDSANNVVTKGASGSTTLLAIGTFVETVDNTGGAAGAVWVSVELFWEITVLWYASVTGANAVTSSALFTDVYLADDQTVTTASSGNSKAGRVWAIDALNGIAVESYLL